MTYAIHEHKHRFAAWAAGRAIRNQVKGKHARTLLEQSDLSKLTNPSSLPAPEDVDAVHRVWRGRMRDAATAEGLDITHGVAAKLINVYLKAVFVCGGHEDHPHIASLHPPIDRRLLKKLTEKFGGTWSAYLKEGWSNFDSDTYEAVVADIRRAVGGRPLWTIEEFWEGSE